MRQTGGDIDGAAVIVGRAAMIRSDNAAARRRQRQRRANAGSWENRANTAGNTPIHRDIRNIIAAGVITRSMYRQGLICGQTSAAQFLTGATCAFHDFDKSQRPRGDGDRAGGIIKKRRVIGDNRAGSGSGCRKSRAGAGNR